MLTIIQQEVQMDIQGVTALSGRPRSSSSTSADEIKEQRERNIKADSSGAEKDAETSANSIQPEELIKNIKALTEDGVYSVRFEIDEATHDLVINLIDQESGEILRQVPSDEVLGTRKFLAELRGNLVETES